MLITQLLTFSGFFNFLFGEGAQQACNKKLALAQRPHLSHYLCDFCTTPENIWTEILLFPKAAAAVFPPPVKILLYHTWQQTEVTEGEINPLPTKHRKWLTVSPPAGYTNPFLHFLLCSSVRPPFFFSASLSLPLSLLHSFSCPSLAELPALPPPISAKTAHGSI